MKFSKPLFSLSCSWLVIVYFVPWPVLKPGDNTISLLCFEAKKGAKKPMTEHDTNMVRTWYEHGTKKTTRGSLKRNLSYPEKTLQKADMFSK